MKKPTSNFIRSLGDVQPPSPRTDLNSVSCENCRYGLWSPDMKHPDDGRYDTHCTIKPASTNGFPIVPHYAVCPFWTDRKTGAQPFRHHAQTSATTKEL